MGRSSSRDERSSRKKKDREESSSSRRKEQKKEKQEKKSKKRDREDSESEQSRRRSKKHRHRDDEDNQRKRNSSSRKGDKKKDRKESRESESRVTVDKSKLSSLGDRLGRAPEEKLDATNDYFQFHRHLWVYLYREEGKTFNDLSSDEARKAFARFVDRYNRGDLEAAYYDKNGLPPDALEETKTTRHAWSFHTTETENRSLHMVQEGVRKQTDYRQSTDQVVVSTAGAASVTPANTEGAPQRRTTNRETDRAVNRRMRDHTIEAADDITGGKKHGRERQLEKKKEVADKTHAASRDRDAGFEMDDEAVYGDKDKSSFQAALERERRRKAKQEETKRNRVGELKKKEDEKREAMLKSLGLTGFKAGQKIKIAPRPESG